MPKTKATTRRSPSALVTATGQIVHRGGAKSWYEKLIKRDRDYVDNVVKELLSNADVSVRGVAAGLKDELGLTASVSVIRNKLGELKRG